jgi:hypothetical protein
MVFEVLTVRCKKMNYFIECVFLNEKGQLVRKTFEGLFHPEIIQGFLDFWLKKDRNENSYFSIKEVER